MEDKSFLEVVSDENIKKIDIDNLLVSAFKNMIIELQNYFNKEGYTKEINYKDFLEEYLLSDSNRKLKIIVTGLLPETVGGDYSSSKCEIRINKDVLNESSETIEHILCHEFIHFLVHHEKDILNGDRLGGETFIDEGYTEQLARMIIPNDSDYYGPIPNILEF